jgi:ArsR family transcriptional regulator, arsenate/arsenite/antimonite-responsive transcriptional repressor
MHPHTEALLDLAPYSRYVEKDGHISGARRIISAQESRLKVFRLLIQRGQEGMAAGDIARNLNLPHNTLSSHLGILSRASLVKSRKESRSIIYSVDLEGTRNLLTFLVEDCCRGKREICKPLIASALAECC